MITRPIPVLVLVLVLVLVTPTAAVAQGFGPKNAVSLHPLSLAAGGLALQYERFAFPPKFSLAAGPSFRSAAGGDYSSSTLALGLEGRVWISGRGAFDDLAPRAMVGPYVSVRLDVGWLGLDDEVRNRSAGSLVLVTESMWLGYRFSFFRHVELSFAAGTALRHELDPSGRIAGYTRWVPIGFGTTLGWMF